MTDALRPIAVETLLRERGWVEGLARSLVLDDATADDVVQQTWLAALESPPREASSLRGWLSRVVRNAASESRRRAARRERWEAAAPRRGPETSPAETVAKADAHRRVVDAVMSLDEPYRTAVLLRFFEDLPSDEVARRTGVPVETARTRIKRALALLRGRLDRDLGGNGRSWALALLPLAGARTGIVGAAKTGTATGGVVMATTTKSVAVAVAVGALIGSLVTTGVMAKSAAAIPSSTESRPFATSTPARETASAAPDSRPPSRDATNAATTARSGLAAALDDVDVALPRSGHGSIAGHVMTQDGKPLAGVVVRAQLPRDPIERRYRRGRAPSWPSVEESVRAAAEDAKWRLATTREAATDAAGAYVVAGLTGDAYWLGAWSDGYEIRLVNVADSSNVRAGATVDFVASAISAVPVTVLLPDGTSPERASARWSAPRGSTSAWWFRDDPVLAIDDGEWTLAAELGTDLRSASVPLTVVAGRKNEPVTLTLVARNVIEGAIRFDPADAGWDYASVTARRRAAQRTEETKSFTARPPDWKFRLEDVLPGEYDLDVSLDGSTSIASAAFALSAGLVTRDLVVPRLGASQFLTARVLGPDGRAIAPEDCALSIVARQSEGYTENGTRFVTAADGSRRVALGSMRASGGRVQWLIRARSERYGTKDAEFVPGKTESVDIQFKEPATFQPTLVGAEGTPLAARLVVTLRSRDESGIDWLSGGSAPLVPVEPGSYVALVSIVDKGSAARVIARIPVDLHAGENPLTINVPELTTLTVHVPGAPGGTRIVAEPARRPGRDSYSRPVLISDDGTASFPELPPGLYVVSVTLRGEVSEMLVRVPVSGVQTFGATPIAGLAVTVEGDGLLAASGFQTGDVIVSMDGTPVDSVARADALLREARARDRWPVEVQRGARRLTLTLDAAKFVGWTARGGWWEPVSR